MNIWQLFSISMPCTRITFPPTYRCLLSLGHSFFFLFSLVWFSIWTKFYLLLFFYTTRINLHLTINFKENFKIFMWCSCRGSIVIVVVIFLAINFFYEQLYQLVFLSYLYGCFNMIFLFAFSWEFDTWRQFGLSGARLSFAWSIKLFFPISRLFIFFTHFGTTSFCANKESHRLFSMYFILPLSLHFFFKCQLKGYMHFGLFVTIFSVLKVILFGYNFFS